MSRLRSMLARFFGSRPSRSDSDDAREPEPAAGAREVAPFLDGGAPSLVVLGLGNPGPKYAATRHNVGFHVVEALATRWGASWRDAPVCEARVATHVFAGRPVLLAMPQTFMNASGRTVEALRAHWPALTPDRFLVVFDDMDLPTGRLRLKAGGGSGGHRGIGDILAVLDDRAVPRLRFGVGHPGSAGQAVLDHVLTPFAPEDEAPVEAAILRAVEAIEVVLRDGLAPAMGQFNARG